MYYQKWSRSQYIILICTGNWKIFSVFKYQTFLDRNKNSAFLSEESSHRNTSFYLVLELTAAKMILAPLLLPWSLPLLVCSVTWNYTISIFTYETYYSSCSFKYTHPSVLNQSWSYQFPLKWAGSIEYSIENLFTFQDITIVLSSVGLTWLGYYAKVSWQDKAFS